LKNLYFVFDLGGTLLKDNQPKIYQPDPKEFIEFGLEIPKNISDIKTIIDQLFVENFKESEKQVISNKIIDDAILKMNLNITRENLIELFWKLLGESNCEYIPLLPGAVELLEKMKNCGMEINALSNTALPLGLLEKILKLYGIWGYFNKIILSGEQGWRKPSSKIFECLEKEIMYTSEDKIIFIGDSYDKDIVPSIERGYETIYICDNQAPKINYTKKPKYTAKNLVEVQNIIFKNYN